jgi:diacylglycerol kinase family enzyme
VRLALVCNRKSGTQTDGDAVAAGLRARGATVDVHAIDELEAVAAGACERVVVAGGDGSVGPVAALAARLGVPMAVVATGTANDFAAALELPTDHDEAVALAASPDAGTRCVDLAWVGDRPFLNAAAAGLSVVAARRATPLKARLGPLAYAVGAVRAGLTARPLAVTVRCDGVQRFSGRAWQVIVASTGAFGGGSEIAAADDDDGLLDAAVMQAGSRVRLLQRAYGVRAGSLTDQGGVHHARGRTIEVDVPAGTSFNVDGEVCRCVPARFTLQRRAVEVVVA